MVELRQQKGVFFMQRMISVVGTSTCSLCDPLILRPPSDDDVLVPHLHDLEGYVEVLHQGDTSVLGAQKYVGPVGQGTQRPAVLTEWKGHILMSLASTDRQVSILVQSTFYITQHEWHVLLSVLMEFPRMGVTVEPAQVIVKHGELVFAIPVTELTDELARASDSI